MKRQKEGENAIVIKLLRKRLGSCFLLFSFLVAGIPASSATAPTVGTPLITGKAPRLSGVLLFHRYTSYNSWNGTMWMIDLKSGHLAEISKNWKTIHSMNGHFSPDGTRIVFMGSQQGEKDWDIFLTSYDGRRWSEPINLTGLNGKRDEDPKFSPDGLSIIYKSDGILNQISLTGTKVAIYATGSTEASMPYFMPNGKDILFEDSKRIKIISDGIVRTVWGGQGLSAYYPIAISSNSFFLTETQSNRTDRIMISNLAGRAKPLFFDSQIWDSSDPYPYQDGSRYLFYVTTNRETGFGGYDLAVADLRLKKTWNLYTINRKLSTSMEELGPSWSATAHYPTSV